jgi:hypothetical protein
MDDNFNDINIISKSSSSSFIEKFCDDITDIINLGDSDLIMTSSNIKDINTKLDNGSENHNVNIAIASAITSYSRIYMSRFKNNNKFKLFYTDTDSVYLNKPLPDDLVNTNELGKFKLEMIAKKAIFLAPKVYCLINLEMNQQLITKVKGLSYEEIIKLTFNDFETLLYKDKTLGLNHNKWYKILFDSSIQIKDQIYTLKVTSNKRELIYDNNNKLINTRPFIIDKDKSIIR